MSLSNPQRSKPKRHEAPPVLGESDLFGLTNQIILIEYNEDENLNILENLIGDKNTLICAPSQYYIDRKNILFSKVDRISQAQVIARKTAEHLDLIIFDRIDMMNIDYDKKGWASQMKYYISMFANPNTLKGCNLIVTSGRSEPLIREIADQFHNLKY